METTSAIVCDDPAIAIAIAEDKSMFYLKAGFHMIADLIAICDPRSYGNQPLLGSLLLVSSIRIWISYYHDAG